MPLPKRIETVPENRKQTEPGVWSTAASIVTVLKKLSRERRPQWPGCIELMDGRGWGDVALENVLRTLPARNSLARKSNKISLASPSGAFLPSLNSVSVFRSTHETVVKKLEMDAIAEEGEGESGRETTTARTAPSLPVLSSKRSDGGD
jgi:hypothetical protein